MANLSVTNIEQTSARAVIGGLLFHAGYYELFEVEIWDFSNTVYSGSTHTWTDPHPTNTYSYLDIYGLDINTGYTFKGFVRNASGRTHVGNVSFFTESDIVDPPPPVRPSNWSWTTLVSSAQTNPSQVYYGTMPLSLVNASEWNDFCARVNEFRLFKGWSTVTFTNAVSSQGFTSSMYQEAVTAISPMATVNQSGGFYTKLINLSSALNSI